MEVKKRVFIGLLGASFFFLIMVIFGIWYIAAHKDLLFNRIILTSFASFLIIGFVVLAFAIISLVYALWRFKSINTFQNLIQGATNLLFPLTIQVGKFFGYNKDDIRSSFIEVSNQLVRARRLLIPPEKILILAPHCLQRKECPYKITINVHNCRQCGGCTIGSLLKLADQYGTKLAVATGGTLARKFIKETKPKAIVAIACERDLTSGIRDVTPLPVLGVLNDRPEGPCLNTLVDLNKVEQAIKFFTKGGGHSTYV